MQEIKDNGCRCEICVNYREFQKHLRTIPETANDYFRGVYDELQQTKYDLDYYKEKTRVLDIELEGFRDKQD